MDWMGGWDGQRAYPIRGGLVSFPFPVWDGSVSLPFFPER